MAQAGDLSIIHSCGGAANCLINQAARSNDTPGQITSARIEKQRRHLISRNDAGGQLLEMLCDYQRRENGGNGWLRIIRFVPSAREMQMRTYSPSLDQFETDANSEFVVPWEMN